MNIIAELINLDTAELSDALDALKIEGALVGISPITPHAKMVGQAYTIKYDSYKKMPTEFQNAGNYIDDVPEGAIVVIDNQGKTDCTTWGDILTRMAIYKKLAGTVVNGAIRDAEFIKNTTYPVFSSGIFMRSGKNRVYKASQQCQLTFDKVSVNPGDYIVGDSNGVICIPEKKVIEVIMYAKNIKHTEHKIALAINKGISLQEARKCYRYDQPWQSGEKQA